MKDIAQGLSNSETTFPSNLPPALPVTTLLAQAFEAKFISNISITVRINTYPTHRIFPKSCRQSFASIVKLLIIELLNLLSYIFFSNRGSCVRFSLVLGLYLRRTLLRIYKVSSKYILLS